MHLHLLQTGLNITAANERQSWKCKRRQASWGKSCLNGAINNERNFPESGRRISDGKKELTLLLPLKKFDYFFFQLSYDETSIQWGDCSEIRCASVCLQNTNPEVEIALTKRFSLLFAPSANIAPLSDDVQIFMLPSSFDSLPYKEASVNSLKAWVVLSICRALIRSRYDDEHTKCRKLFFAPQYLFAVMNSLQLMVAIHLRRHVKRLERGHALRDS